MKSVLSAVLGGLLLGIGFISAPLWPLVFIGAFLFIKVVIESKAGDSELKTFLLGWLMGTIVVGCAMYGLYWHTLPLDWLGLGESVWQVVLVGFIWGYTALTAGLAYGLGALASRALSTKTWADVFIIPSIWVFMELLSAVMLYVQGYGPGGRTFSFNHAFQFVGYQLAESTVLLQLAYVGSVFALSAFVFFIASIIYRLYSSTFKKEKKILSVIIGVMAIFCIGGQIALGTQDISQDSAKTALFAVLSTHMKGQDTKTQLAMQQVLLENLEVDVVVLPEGAEFFSKLQEYGGELPTSAGLYIDSTVEHGESGDTRVRANYYSPKAEQTTYTYKYFLLPIGEYIPSVLTFVSNLSGFSKTDTFDYMLQYRRYIPSTYPVPVIAPDGTKLGALFCNESVSPTLYRSLTRGGAEVLINMSSHLWFNNSQIVFTNQQHAAKVRAVESGRWYVQANNMAPTYILDNYGRVVLQTAWGAGDGVLRTDVPLRNTTTPYIWLGLWVLVLPGLIILATLFWIFIKKRLF